MAKYHIIYQDRDILIINKPPGVVVNRAQTVAEETIQDWLEAQVLTGQEPDIVWPTVTPGDWSELIPSNFTAEFGEPQAIFNERLGVAHRLDKETSGALVIAKNPGALVNVLAQFKQRLIQKEYLCLVHGKFSITNGDISVPIGRSSQNRLQFSVQADGRPALTTYQVTAYYPHLDLEAIIKLPTAAGSNIKKRSKIYQGFSLVTCQPKTGRTHQIRVHMAYMKHPLVGDTLYAGQKRQVLDAVWCPRHFLHAQSITLKQPRTGAILTVHAELTADLQATLDLLLQD